MWNSVRIRLESDAADGAAVGGIIFGEIDEPEMTYVPRMRPGTRAPRVSVQGRVMAVLQLENGRRIPAKLQKFSVTGGLLELTSYLEERAKVKISIPVGSVMVRPEAEMLFPMPGVKCYLQPFRFTSLWAEERQVLEAEITQLLKQSPAGSTAGPGAAAPRGPFYLESF